MPDRQQLLDWVDAERDRIFDFYQGFVRTKSPNPPVVSLGGTDARLWRYENIPAYVYGPFPTGMGSFDENVPTEDFFHVVRTHVLSAYDYLMAS